MTKHISRIMFDGSTAVFVRGAYRPSHTYLVRKLSFASKIRLCRVLQNSCYLETFGSCVTGELIPFFAPKNKH